MKPEFSSSNPFFSNRAEQMGADLWKYYVDLPFSNLLGTKPLIVEGGRGCGKSMFFICTSWVQQLRKARRAEHKLLQRIKNGQPVGIYYKVDSLLTTAMTGEGLPERDWQRVFSTYFNLVITREAAVFVSEIAKEAEKNQLEFSSLFDGLGRHLGEKEWAGEPSDYVRLCEERLNYLETYVNNVGQVERPLTLSPGTLIEDFVTRFTSVPNYEDTVFHILIDEYENLYDYQQRIINTLLKHSSRNLIYDISVRRKGMRENRTLNPAEVIQPPHDYRLHRPEDALSEVEYHNLLKAICKKRFEQAGVEPGPDGQWHDIEFYLGKYDVRAEIDALTKATRREVPYKKMLKQIVYDEVSDEQEAKRLYEILGENDNPLLNRLHLCILLRQKPHKRSVRELAEIFQEWKARGNQVYKEWLHDAQLGLVFLLARDHRRHKMYFGFDVFSMLSSGIVRYFLELCLHTFEFASAEGFSFDSPRLIEMEIQTKAARYVSRYKVDDIETYSPHGRRLKKFILILGGVFEALHKHKKTTLGEPEPNHFHTKTLELESEDSTILDSAVMWAALQERIPTKEKQADLSLEAEEYHLNHIYCPYFEISYRRKRRLYIPPKLLQRMMSPKFSDAKAAAKELLERHQADLLSEEDMISPGSIQLSLFARK